MKRLGKLLIPFIILIVLLVVFQAVLLPRILRSKITQYVSENCASCQLDVGQIHVTLILFNVGFERVRLTGGEIVRTSFEARIPRIVADLSFMPLMAKHVLFEYYKRTPLYKVKV